MSRAPIDLYPEEMQVSEPGPDELAEIVEGFRRVGVVFALGVLIGLFASSIL